MPCQARTAAELVTGSWWAVPAPVGHTNEEGALESTAHVLYANYLPGIGRGLWQSR